MFKLADFEVKEIFPLPVHGDDYLDWGLKVVGVEEAWKNTKGQGIKVAILDTGVDSDHRDLASNIKETADFTGSKSGAEDTQGHGSHVAGVVAAVENKIGVIGVAPYAELYCAKVLGDNGNGSFESIIKGIRWAIEKEVDVISMSLGSASRPPQIFHDTIKEARDKGIIMVAATGNENSPVCYPAAYDEVIAVSAVDQGLERAQFSNYGIQNEICAPGVDIVSTYKNGTYAKLSGTSMATPIIAGACALIISRQKQLFNGIKPCVKNTHQILTTMVRDLGSPGRDELYGEGILDLSKLP